MTITTIEFVDADLSTVLFDLHSSTGSTNSSWGSVITKFGLGGSFKVDAPHDAERFQRGSDGAFTTFSRRGLGTATWRQFISGSSEANLRLGVTQLVDLVTRGGILKIVTSTTTRYLRFEPSNYPKPFAGKELELHDIYQQFAFRQGLDIELACQPYWEGAETTIGPSTITNDPSGTNGRALAVTIAGGLPVPVMVECEADGSSKTLSTSAAADDIIDCTNHEFQVGDPVTFTALTGGSGLTTGTLYYVISANFGASTFQVATTYGGTAVNFTTDITAGSVELVGRMERVLVAAHTTAGERDSAALTAYSGTTNPTRYAQCEASGNNWTVTLGTDTSAASDVTGSPGTGNTHALVSFATVTAHARRVRITRTADLDSLRGAWDVYLRVRGATGISGPFSIQHRWGPSLDDPVAFTNASISYTEQTFGGNGQNWSDLYMGTCHLPMTGTLAGLTHEVWAGSPGGDDLLLDHLFFVSRDQQGVMTVPIADADSWLGSALISPVANPAGGTAGTVVGTGIKLDTTTDNAGTDVLGLGVGRHIWTYRVGYTGSGTFKAAIRNTTDSADATSRTESTTSSTGTRENILVHDATPGKSYQGQIDDPSSANIYTVKSWEHSFTPFLGLREAMRSNPQGPSVDRLDASGNITGYLVGEGGVPAVLSPGPNVLSFLIEDVPHVGTDVKETRETRRTRNLQVTVTYFPRYAF